MKFSIDRRRSLQALFGVLTFACALAHADERREVPARADPVGQARPVEFKPGVYRGNVGGRELQMELDWSTSTRDSVEGSYFFFGDSLKVLVAGEIDGADFSMEESRNGTDVSGTWIGVLEGHSIRGIWADENDSHRTEFLLTRTVLKGDP